MALKAGYKGVKNSFIAAVNSLVSLGIKSLGSMFNVSSAGELTVKKATTSAAGIVKPDGTTITINNGTISAAAAGNFDLLFGSTEPTYPASTDTAIELSEDFTDYDILVFIMGYRSGDDHTAFTGLVPTALLDSDLVPLIELWGPSNQYVRIAKGVDNTHIAITYNHGEEGIYQVYGIKF